MPRDRTTTTQRALAALVLFAAIQGATGTTGCAETSSASSHVRAGDLYAPGQDRYDDYFAAVHSQQATAAQWAADRKSAHQALVTALKLDGDAADSAIAQAAHAKATPPRAVTTAIEQAVRADTDRAKGLDAVASKIDELVKTGHELEGHVSEDFGKPGSGQSGPSPADVKMELRVSYEVLSGIRERAKHEAKAAEGFIAALQHPSDAHATRHTSTSKPSGTAAPTASPASTAAPAPKPQPKPEPGEVFQP